MTRRLLHVAVALALLAACGGSNAPQPVPLTCASTANGGTLPVNPPAPGYTCGTATWPTTNVYTFTAAAGAHYTVTLVTSAGDADLCVRVQAGGLVGCSINFPPMPDTVTFTAPSGAVYQVEVDDASIPPTPSSSYGVVVTSP